LNRIRKLTIAVASVLGITGVAFATTGGQPDADAVSATFQLTEQSTHERECAGQDGQVREERAVYRGPIDGSDPRLDGTLVLKTRTLLDVDEQVGTTVGRAKVLDPATNRVKAKGVLTAVNTQLGKLEGFVAGKVKNGGTPEPRALFANFSATFNAAGTEITGELGEGAGTNSAVLFSGGCPSEKSRHHDGDSGHERSGRHHKRDDD
jgi:hypothetical protein